MWPSALRLLLAGACLSLVVSGCSEDDPEPRLSPGGSSSSAPAPSPSGPVEPTLPPEAEGSDAAAAEAFVRHYWAMVNYAQETGDVSGLRALATEACRPCATAIDSVEDAYANGGVIRGGAATLSGVRSTPIATRAGNAVQVKMRIATTDQVVDRPGAGKDETYPAGEVRASFVVEPQQPGWLVSFWEVS